MMLFFTQLAGELRKLFARKRTYIGFGAFLVIELLILVLLQLPKNQHLFRMEIEKRGYGFDQYFSGLTLAHQMLSWTVFFLGALYLALVAGDVVAKEVEDGTMRMMLCRPVSRLRILSVKYIACIIYTFVLIAFIGGTAMAAGISWRGTGGLFVVAPVEGIFALYDFGTGLSRFLTALPLLSLSLLSISTLGFALSCFNMKPAAATICTLSYFFVDMIFRGIPYFASMKHWFLSTHMATWLNVFQSHIPVAQMIEDYSYLLGVNATLLIVAAVSFQLRDFKS